MNLKVKITGTAKPFVVTEQQRDLLITRGVKVETLEQVDDYGMNSTEATLFATKMTAEVQAKGNPIA